MVPSQVDNGAAATKETKAPVVLSEGAGVALSTVFNRLVKPKASDLRAQAKGKRPRSDAAPVILAESEQVQEELSAEREQIRKSREAKKAKIKFQSNARVIPDAATNAALEKELLATATKGAVALFNAVSKARKTAVDEANSKSKRGPALSRESFMDMIRAGVSKEQDEPIAGDDDNAGDSADEKAPASGVEAKWLKDDFVTSKSKKPKDWDKDSESDVDVSSEGDDDDDSGDDIQSEDSADESD